MNPRRPGTRCVGVTDARIALAQRRQPAHAKCSIWSGSCQSRDAIHRPFDSEQLAPGWRKWGSPRSRYAGAAGDRHILPLTVRIRRRLDEASR